MNEAAWRNIMDDIVLLDCTLRDGGYLNDWNFGHTNLISMLERLVNAGIDIIELGFLDERRTFDINCSIMPSTECMEKIYGSVDKRNAMTVGMIDYGTCSLRQIQPADESYLDGIRVIFKKHLMHEAMKFCYQLKKLGYHVFSQMVSITSYSDDELEEFIEIANKVKPFAVSMVDTYGLLYKDNLLHFYEILDRGLDREIRLGYHSHNNFQLAYSNCMEVLRSKKQRPILVDGTLYGMGKSAGNAPLELLAMHMNEHYAKEYDIAQILEAINGSVMQVFQNSPWGYNLFYYLAASNSCHPSYVRFLMDKHALSVKEVNELLDRIDIEKKLLYDERHIEKIYYQYQRVECDDTLDRRKLAEAFRDRKILAVGPGSSVKNSINRINDYIDAETPCVIAVNFIPDNIKADYIFLSNPKRYIRLMSELKKPENCEIQIIAMSNVTKENGSFEYVINNSNLIDVEADIIDNSFIMLLKLLKDLSINQIICAGFDGYSKTEENYADKTMEYWFSKSKSEELNQSVIDYLDQSGMGASIIFITKSHYEV